MTAATGARRDGRARAAANPAWPGITTGLDARCLCTLALKDGVLQVKHLNAACPSHRDARARDGCPAGR